MRTHASELRFPADFAFLHRGANKTRTDAIHPNSLVGDLPRECLREAHDRELAGGVVRKPWSTGLPGKRSGVHDSPYCAGLLKMPDSRLVCQEDSSRIDIKIVVPFL